MSKSPISPAAAGSLLAKLEAKYGPSVLASLIGAGFAQDNASDADLLPDDPLTPADWLLEFESCTTFRDAAGL